MLELLIAALALAVLASIVRPLLRGAEAPPDSGAFDRAVYRDQLAEIDRDIARGVLSDAEAAAARLEVQRRLLAVPDAAPGRRAGASPSWAEAKAK